MRPTRATGLAQQGPRSRVWRRAVGCGLSGFIGLVSLFGSPAAIAGLPGCDPAPAANGAPTHPLACHALSADGAELDWAALVAKVAAAPVALLGEVHDNPHHHRIRAQLVLALEARRNDGPRPGLVLEHIRVDQDLALSSFRALDRRQRREAADLFTALDWDNSGWPARAVFQPILDAALDAEWPLIPGNLERSSVRAVARQGLAAVPADEVQRLGLGEPLPDPAQADLLDELEASHCGLLPRAAFGGMADAQRYRDAHMAQALVDAQATHGRAILLAGNGHVRLDRGVPWHVRRLKPGLAVLSVMLLEVDDGKQTAGAYAPRRPDGETVADVVVLTPPVVRPDPCIEMRQRHGK